MEEQLKRLELDMIALRSVVTSLWSNYLANGTPDPIGTAKRLSREGREDIGTMLREPAASENPYLEETIHEIQDRMELFWQSVERLLEQRS